MPTIDWTVSQAIGDQPVDSELYRLRAAQESAVGTARSRFQATHASAEALRVALEADNGPIPDPDVDTETILTLVATFFPRLLKVLRRAERIQEAFRIRHGLTRAPIAPQTLQNLLFLAILIFIEAGINAGFFLSAYMAAGPITALLISLLISVTNVTANTCAGYFIGRWKNYGIDAEDAETFQLRRSRARVQFWGFVTVMVLFHITVGLVRSLETMDSVHHSLGSYFTLLTTPGALFLVLTGVCMSVLSYSKGLHAFDDPYPGYGACYRSVLSARDDLLDLFDETAEEIEERFAEARKTVNKAWRRRKWAICRYEWRVNACRRARRNLEQAAGRAETGLKTKIASLAGHHRAARGDHTQLSACALDQLSSFDDLLEGCEPPPYLHLPDRREATQRLERGKADALARLSALFEQTMNASPEKTHETT